MVWPAFVTSSWARFSRSASTAAANRRSSRARSAGATARPAGPAAWARAMAASVSSRDVRATDWTTASVAGLMTSKVVTAHPSARHRGNRAAVEVVSLRLLPGRVDESLEQPDVLAVLLRVPLHPQHE